MCGWAWDGRRWVKDGATMVWQEAGVGGGWYFFRSTVFTTETDAILAHKSLLRGGLKAEGQKDDNAKPRWDLLPWRATAKVVDVMTYGAKKYAPENWRKVADWRWRYYSAALRHLTAWWLGEKVDPESGLPHLAHAACCILFLLELGEKAS